MLITCSVKVLEPMRTRGWGYTHIFLKTYVRTMRKGSYFHTFTCSGTLAQRRCRENIDVLPKSAEVHIFLALIHDSTGDIVRDRLWQYQEPRSCCIFLWRGRVARGRGGMDWIVHRIVPTVGLTTADFGANRRATASLVEFNNLHCRNGQSHECLVFIRCKMIETLNNDTVNNYA